MKLILAQFKKGTKEPEYIHTIQQQESTLKDMFEQWKQSQEAPRLTPEKKEDVGKDNISAQELQMLLVMCGEASSGTMEDLPQWIQDCSTAMALGRLAASIQPSEDNPVEVPAASDAATCGTIAGPV